MCNRLIVLLLLVAPLWLTSANATARVDFVRGNLGEVKDRAAAEGKLYFVSFTASWCMPCKWMEETTFTDREVADYIGANYIPVKVDIDDFDGYAYKQVHNIKLLPSILIFNSRGQEVDRYEESLSATRLLDILQKNNTAGNRMKTKKSRPVVYHPSPAKEQVVYRPPLGRTNPSRITATKVHSDYSPASSAPHRPEEGLFRFKVKRQPSVGFSIQIGAFVEYGNVLTEAARLEELFDQPVIVQIAKLNNRTVYKVLVGEFGSRSEAIHFKAAVQQKGMEAIIKDLSMMK